MNLTRKFAEYQKRFPKSQKIFTEARDYIPAGVNSTARATWSGWEPFPLSVAHGQGSHVTDVDGHTYIDYLLGLGPMMLGHRPEKVTAAVTAHLQTTGTVFALPSELDTQVAKKMIQSVPSLERVRLNNSGTEAVTYAIRLARAYTNRKKIIRFEGMYHGFDDGIYWSKHPSDSAINNDGTYAPEPQGPGLPEGIAESLIILGWNDLPSLRRTLEENHEDIAGIITEPIMCNTGCILPLPGYLEEMRALTEKYGIVLIFDEVITGFRIALGGAQAYFGIKPDISVFAKGMGGGYPVAALGGKKEIMDLIDTGVVSVAGTYSGNGIALAAVSAPLDVLAEPTVYQEFYRKSQKLMTGLDTLWRASAIDAYVVGLGPVFQVWFASQPIHNYRDAKKYAREDLFYLWWEEMLFRGVLFHPHYYENIFVSLAHTDADIDQTLEIAAQAVAAVEKRVFS